MTQLPELKLSMGARFAGVGDWAAVRGKDRHELNERLDPPLPQTWLTTPTKNAETRNLSTARRSD